MLKQGCRHAERWWVTARRASAVALALTAAMAVPAVTAASPTANVSLTFPASVTVGESGSGSLTIANASTFEDPSFTLCSSGENGPCAGSDGIVITPSCAQVVGGGGTLTCTAGGADAGVLQLDKSATGAAGSRCEGVLFLLEPFDAARGTFRISPTGGQDIRLAIAEQCRVDFTFRAMRMPALDGSGQPGAQTLPVATVGGRTYLSQPVAGGTSSLLTVTPAPPPPPSVTAVVPGSPSNDNLPEVVGTAAAGTTVNVYADVACGGSAVVQGAAEAFVTVGLTAAVADNTTTTFAATVTDPATGLSSPCSASSGSYVEDSAPPDTTIVAGPSGTTDDDAPVFRFLTDDPGATLSCRRNGAAFLPCVSPLQLPILQEADYSFEVRATDGAGNTDPTPASRAFAVGTTFQTSSLSGCSLRGKPRTGTPYNDDLRGTAAIDLLVGMSGSDVLRGLGGRDCLSGQGGTDRLYGGTGADQLFGGTDNDVLRGDSGNDRVNGESGVDRLDGGSGNDRLGGGSGNDRLTDRRGRDTFIGGAGHDRIDARDSAAGDRRKHDVIRCGAGHDTVLADRRDKVARDCERVTRR